MQSAGHFGPGSSSSVLHLKLQGIYDIQDVRISITKWSDKNASLQVLGSNPRSTRERVLENI